MHPPAYTKAANCDWAEVGRLLQQSYAALAKAL